MIATLISTSTSKKSLHFPESLLAKFPGQVPFVRLFSCIFLRKISVKIHHPFAGDRDMFSQSGTGFAGFSVERLAVSF